MGHIPIFVRGLGVTPKDDVARGRVCDRDDTVGLRGADLDDATPPEGEFLHWRSVRCRKPAFFARRLKRIGESEIQEQARPGTRGADEPTSVRVRPLAPSNGGTRGGARADPEATDRSGACGSRRFRAGSPAPSSQRGAGVSQSARSV